MVAAFEMAEKFSAELMFVHVITLASKKSGALQRATDMQCREANAHESMTHLIKEAVPAQIKCRSRIIGDMLVQPADAIVQLAKEEAADMIVLAAMANPVGANILRLLSAESVVRLSICPVLKVKRSTQI